MTKYFVLRPHALLSSEDSLQKFGEDNVIVVPLAVIDEVQKMKDLNHEKRKIAKKILQYLRRASKKGALTEKGFKQENGSILRIETNQKDIDVDVPDVSEWQKRTLQVCLGLINKLEKESEGGSGDKGENSNDTKERVILITNNVALSIKAQTLGIHAEPFKDEIFPELSQQYKGRMTVHVSADIIDSIHKNEEIEIEEIYNYKEFEWVENCIVTLVAEQKSQVYCMVKGNKLVFVNPFAAKMYGVKPMTKGQEALICALMSDCPLVVVKGTAGTGKTLLALASCLEEYDKGTYRRINITSPVFNDELGYLPGDIDEKVSPFLSGILHNLEYLINNGNKSDTRNKENPKEKKKLSFSSDRPNYDWSKPSGEDGTYFFEKGIIRILAIRTLRGASILEEVFIVDEAQNIEPEKMKTIITRMGKGSRIIICGDPTQVDHPALDERYNGLVYVAEKMKGSLNTVVVSFEENETVRSDLAKEAAERL